MQNPHKLPAFSTWKEIAEYLGRGVRTVQRYERDLKLPVRRPRNKSRSAVIALTADLDEWLRRIPQSALSSASAKAALPHEASALHDSLSESHALHELCRQLRKANAEAMRTLVDTLEQTRELLQTTRQTREELAFVRNAILRNPTRPRPKLS